jgi:hypothetical protein
MFVLVKLCVCPHHPYTREFSPKKKRSMTIRRLRGTEGSDDNLIPFPTALWDVESGFIEP